MSFERPDELLLKGHHYQALGTWDDVILYRFIRKEAILSLIHMGVVSIALPNFEELLLRKSLSKICLEKLCNPS
jgi:hypothetical protein